MRYIYIIIMSLFTVSLMGQNQSEFQSKSLIQDNDTLLYRVLYPENYDKTKSYPLVVFLHGAGERGNDNKRQLFHGSSLFLKSENRTNYPAIIIFPQCPTNSAWFSAERGKGKDGKRGFTYTLPEQAPVPSELVNKLVDQYIGQGKVKTDQVYIMGLSMGGMGTLEHLARWGDKYAAAICICGAHNPEFTNKYSDIPIWFTHGGMDDVVKPYLSMDIYSELCKESGMNNYRYTLFEKANHNSWDPTFAIPDLLEWLFKHKKATKQ